MVRRITVEDVLGIFWILSIIVILVCGILYILYRNKEHKKMCALGFLFMAIILLMKVVLEYVVYKSVMLDLIELIVAGASLITAKLLTLKRDA